MVITNKKTVLIVDDQKAARETMRMVLKDFYNCILARGYREGLELLSKEKIDVALLDYDLGTNQHNGLDLLSAARDMGVKTKFIMISGKGLREIREDAVSRGASRFLDKPIDNNELLDAIESVSIDQKGG